jgi:hypothetical protein
MAPAATPSLVGTLPVTSIAPILGAGRRRFAVAKNVADLPVE